MVPVEDVYNQLADFARDHGVSRLTLFGSRARGTSFPKSDIDVAVVGGDVDGFRDDVNERLWSLLDVDVVEVDERTSRELLSEIARDGRVLYEAS